MRNSLLIKNVIDISKLVAYIQRQIQSTAGVNGGYSLRKLKTEISFYDVIQAIEGSGALFTCEMDENRACPIEKVMRDAEAKMVNDLKENGFSTLSKR